MENVEVGTDTREATPEPWNWARLSELVSLRRSAGATAQEAVSAALRIGILQGLLPAGEHLSQEAIAASLNVSRIPVREALRRLENEGLVRFEARRGFRTAVLDSDAIEEIYEFRALIETHVMRLAIPLLTDADLEELRSIHVRSEEVQEVETQRRLRDAFYRRLYLVAGRPRMVEEINKLHNEVVRLIRSRPLRHRTTAHRDIFAAVERGDADEACRLLDDHYRQVSAALRRFVRGAHSEMRRGMPDAREWLLEE